MQRTFNDSPKFREGRNAPHLPLSPHYHDATDYGLELCRLVIEILVLVYKL